MALLDRKAPAYSDVALLLGRILMAILFLVASYNKFKALGGTGAYFTKLGVPAGDVVAPLTATFELAVGALLIIGYQVRCVSIAMAIFVVIAALLAHMNWADSSQLNHFLKNLAIAGGALALFVSGPGKYSVDARR
jgi:putative oxidoreductase